MTHGVQDFGASSGQNSTYGLTDLGELAVRLGSPVSFDRRGDVVMMETFEDGLDAWATAGDGHGWAVDLSLVRHRTARLSARLVAGSNSDRYADMWRYVPLAAVGRHGLELAFLCETYIDNIGVTLRIFTGAQWVEFTCNYYVATGVITVHEPNFRWPTVATLGPLIMTDRFFHSLKLVGDVRNQSYAYLLIDGNVIDLTSYVAYIRTDTRPPSAQVGVISYGQAAQNGISYIDDIILTQNEP